MHLVPVAIRNRRAGSPGTVQRLVLAPPDRNPQRLAFATLTPAPHSPLSAPATAHPQSASSPVSQKSLAAASSWSSHNRAASDIIFSCVSRVGRGNREALRSPADSETLRSRRASSAPRASCSPAKFFSHFASRSGLTRSVSSTSANCCRHLRVGFALIRIQQLLQLVNGQALRRQRRPRRPRQKQQHRPFPHRCNHPN